MKMKLLSMMLTAAMTIGLLTGCGQAAGSNGAKGQIKDLVTWEVPNREMENCVILNTEMANDLNVLGNCVEGLLETDAQGKLNPGLAKEWGTEDGGLTWTFKLREGVKWVDVNGNVKADCTAQDFVTGLEWVMNFHKKISMPLILNLRL